MFDNSFHLNFFSSSYMEQIIQAFSVYLSFAAVAINTVFVVLVLVRAPHNDLTITFLLLSIASIIWNFGIFMSYFGEEEFWHHISRIGSPFLPALLFQFAHSLVRPVTRTNRFLLAYLLAGLLSVSSFLAIFHPGIRLFANSKFWSLYFLCVLYPFILAGLTILRGAIRNFQSFELRNRISYFYWATIIAMLMGAADLLRDFGVALPRLGHVGSVLYSTVLAVGIIKYRSSYDIIAQMQIKLDFLSEIAAGIAHEVRTPLNSIKGAGNLLSAELKREKTGPAGEYIDIITEEITRLDNILASFQNLARPLQVVKERLPVNDVIRKTIQLAEVGELPLEITTELAAGLPALHADSAALKQVFLNLMKNAAEAGNDQVKLQIATVDSPPGVKIIFRDNGQGIPAEVMNHLFEPFFTTKKSGMGLGLAISRRIVQAHSGHLEARNIEPRGAEFSIYLPYLPKEIEGD